MVQVDEERGAGPGLTGASEEPVVLEASWAPRDPRDKLYDSNASRKEKTESLFRIIAAFHPVLNLPVVFFDLFKTVRWYWACAILGAFVGLIFWAFFR